MSGIQAGDQIRVTGRRHPWRGATGTVDRAYYGAGRLTWVLRLDPPWGYPAYGWESCAADADVRLVTEEPQDLFTCLVET